MMSKAIFDKLPKNQQDVILSWSAANWKRSAARARRTTIVEVAKVYEKAGAKVSKLDVATVNKWRDIARGGYRVEGGLHSATTGGQYGQPC